MQLYSSDVDQATGDVSDFASSGKMAIVEAGVTLDAEAGIVFYSKDVSYETIINYGNIYGDDGGIDLLSSGAGYDEIRNYGVIGGGALETGISEGGPKSTIVNAGLVFGSQYGINLVGVADTVTNTGTISCPFLVGNTGPTAAVYIQADQDAVTNRGTIDGDILSVSTSAHIRNAGTIDGNVTFSSGTNAYDGRGGTVDGIITGGAGSDTIRAGNDGETIVGGKGYDYLYAGAGSDTFILNSTATADRDRIHGFDVAHDQIELDHTAFTTLGVDVTPAFAIGTAASSATDHLFYDSSNGLLWYDKDGSGTAHAAIEIAHLDPGLKLTAADFIVV